MLSKIKLLLGLSDNSKDELLTVLLDQAVEEAILYTHNNDTAQLEGAIINMVVFKYNRIGTEGVDSEGYSGVSFSYSADYPEAIMRQLRSKRKIRTI